VLTPYPAENLRPEKTPETEYQWVVLAGAVVVLIAGVVVVWSLKHRTSGGGSST